MAGPYRERLYDAAEVRRILGRAARLQDDGGRPAEGGARALTMDEIGRLASDMGIADEALRRAMGDEGERAPRPEASIWAGAPRRIAVERAASGRLDASMHAALVRRVRHALGEAGDTQLLGDSLTWRWTPAPGARQVHVSVEPEGDSVVVRAEENLGPLMGALFGGVVGGAGGGGAPMLVALVVALGVPALIPVAVVAWVFLVYALTRALFVRRAHARTAELTALADDLARRVEALSSPTGGVETRARVGGPARVVVDDAAAEAEAEAEVEMAGDRAVRR